MKWLDNLLRTFNLGGVETHESTERLESDMATEAGIAQTLPAAQRVAILEQEFERVDNAKPKARFKVSKGSNRERIAVQAFGTTLIKKRKSKF